MRFLNQLSRLSALFLFPILFLLLLLLRSALHQFVRLDLAATQQLGRRRPETFMIALIANGMKKLRGPAGFDHDTESILE